MANLELGKTALESLGFKVVFGELAGKQYGYLSGTDKERAAEFMGLATRKDIDAVICARGGYGIMRLLPLLDYTALANNPKVICGYSDITALINTIYQRCGFVCFHGPGASGTPDEFTVKGLSAVAFTDDERRAKIRSEGFTPTVIDAPNGFETISGGKARGRLVGGNLTLLAHLTGTPFQVSTKPETTREKTGKILFFEDVTEQPYRIDRMLTQLLIAGTLQQCAGIAIGQFTRCEPEDPVHSFTVAEVLKDRLAELGIPVISGLQFGHVAKQYTLPLGVMAELDADAGTLTLLEEAVQI
jgi:muramoyltetrapeptide carboxypeptidase